MKSKIFKGLLFLGIVAFFCACNIGEGKRSNQHETPDVQHEITGKAQGTTYSIKYFGKNNEEIPKSITTVLEEIDRCFSLWRDDSELVRVNNSEGPYKLNDPNQYFEEVFQLSKDIAQRTDHDFNPALHPIISAWGFSRKSGKVLTQKEVDSLLQTCSFNDWELNDEFLSKKNGSLDFNGIAQGYTVDVLAKTLEDFGISNYFVEVGGETKVKGVKPDGELWRIGIDKPIEGNEREIQEILSLTNKAVVTSGSYRKFKEVDGKKYSHTIDPQTGFPAMNTLLSVTLIMDQCAEADALATAMMVMGREKAIAFAQNLDRIDGFYLIYNEKGKWQTYSSVGFDEYLAD
ncbi:MAG: FAD:protein FMN transferase [Bacteroidota bacterium]